MCWAGVQRAVVGGLPGAGVRSQLSGAERGVAVDGPGLEPRAAGTTAVAPGSPAAPVPQSGPHHARYVHALNTRLVVMVKCCLMSSDVS